MREGAGEAKMWKKRCAGPSQGTKGTLVPQGLLSLSNHYPTSIPHLIPTFTILLPLCFCLREQCWKVGHEEELPQGNAGQPVPIASSAHGVGNEGSTVYAEGRRGGGLLPL